MLTNNIARASDGTLFFAGHSVKALAEKYGTPLYLMDEERIRANCRMYADAFARHFGPSALPLYASKAASFTQIYRIIAAEGLGTDVVSGGELATALRAGFPAESIYFHGNVKTDAEIRLGVETGVGWFVVDNPEELLAVAREAGRRNRRQKVLLRVTPGIDPHTYDAVNTGMVDSKFGVAIDTGQAMDFVRQALSLPELEVTGLHCHVGSMVFDEDVFERTAEIMLRFLAEIRSVTGVTLGDLNLGGGYGTRYLESDGAVDIPGRIAVLAEHIRSCCAGLSLPLPRILMEPGRSIVADAGLTVYTVGSVKRIPGYKSYAAVDGGMSDNPRYALYGSPYTVLHAERAVGPTAIFDLVGRCCESGDIIQPRVELPADIRRGDLVAVCTTGAYNYSMASNYNRIPRPPIVMLTPESDYTAVRRETYEDLYALDN